MAEESNTTYSGNNQIFGVLNCEDDLLNHIVDVVLDGHGVKPSTLMSRPNTNSSELYVRAMLEQLLVKAAHTYEYRAVSLNDKDGVQGFIYAHEYHDHFDPYEDVIYVKYLYSSCSTKEARFECFKDMLFGPQGLKSWMSSNGYKRLYVSLDCNDDEANEFFKDLGFVDEIAILGKNM